MSVAGNNMVEALNQTSGLEILVPKLCRKKALVSFNDDGEVYLII
jgi:hypothetical protein